ncbi:MAG: TonB-dependent receptor [Porphyrobacter sp.]|nr:TonB-dependent receptor [Porphyrobacter sp.]
MATQARVSIDLGDPALAKIKVPALRGRFTVSEALTRLLRGTPYTFAMTRGNVVRLVRRPAPPVSRPDPRPRPQLRPEPAAADIIVTASKQPVQLGAYPGAIEIAQINEQDSLRFGSSGSAVLLRELPNLVSTNLGSGRNKIFVRGIADSSFNGQSQAVVSQYFGESRLTYSAPDPDLALYDVRRVEVIEGPQGTLYGAGSLGGVIRIEPNAPEPGVMQASAVAALNVTSAKIGGEGAFVTNIPFGSDTALRLVGYKFVRPGYIDDLERGLSDINRTTVTGLRGALRFQPNAAWTIDVGGLAQDTASRDGQYTDGPRPERLVRRSALAQPFDNDYRLAHASARGDLGFAQIVSAFSFTHHEIGSVFDATPPGGMPTAFAEATRVSLLTHETRLSSANGAAVNWVAGFAFMRNVDRVIRRLGPPGALEELSSTRSQTLDAALFGEATVPLWRTISVTGGGRLSWVRQVDEFTVPVGEAEFEPGRNQFRFLPTAALSWRPNRAVIAYLRYQDGFRPGAQQLTGNAQQASVTRFRPDEIHTAEVGARFGLSPGARLSGGASLSVSRWNRVQADLVTQGGFPYVANLGSAYVRYASAYLAWKPSRDVVVEASGFLAASHLDRAAAGFETARERDLPNISDSGWRLTTRVAPRIGGVRLTLDGTIGYVGTSYLGIGAPFDLPQGDYLDTALGARAEFGGWGLSVDVENLTDSRANRFSYGNPFSVARGDQRTPLRPRTVRIGIDATF